jgi:hypothetical protein
VQTKYLLENLKEGIHLGYLCIHEDNVKMDLNEKGVYTGLN